MERRSPKKVAVKEAAATLENREVPASSVRPAAVARYIASRQTPQR